MIIIIIAHVSMAARGSRRPALHALSSGSAAQAVEYGTEWIVAYTGFSSLLYYARPPSPASLSISCDLPLLV